VYPPAKPAAGAPPAAARAPAPKGAPPPKDWKRHVLLRVGAAPFELPPDKTITIGRADECELSIPSARISRKHAEIFWRDGKPHVKDLGSQNGTQVNGKRVTEHLLADNDEVTIGPFLVTYRCMGGAGSVGKMAQGPDKNALTQPMLADAMAGRLDQMGMFELLQTLEFNKKSGTLELFGTEDGDGRIALQDGAPIHAECEGLAGEEAMLRMVRQKAGQFSLSPQVEVAERTIHKPMTNVLLEAGRREDESHAPPPG
jgi:hypothetical protein